ncbi:MAG: VOC family protein [Bacteroidota bacterium]
MPRPLRLACLFLVLGSVGCVSVSVEREPPAVNEDGVPRLVFEHQALQVADLDRSAAFYTGTLGLAEIPTPPGARGIRWFELGDGLQLHLIENDAAQTIPKGTHLALATPDIDALAAYLDAQGVLYFDWPGVASTISTRGDGIRQVYIRDPDGHWIEINNVER